MAVPRRLALFLSLWHCHDIKHGGCTTQHTCQPGSSMLFLCFSSHCKSTGGCCWTTKNCWSVLGVWSHRRWWQPSKYLYWWSFSSALVLDVLAFDFLSLADIACEPGKFCASFFFGSMTGHCPSPYQIVAIQCLWRRWATFSQKMCPSIGFIFPCQTVTHRRRQACLVNGHCQRSGDVGQPTKCTKPLPWSEVSSWSIFVLLLKRHTGVDTKHQSFTKPGRKEETVRSHLDQQRFAIF